MPFNIRIQFSLLVITSIVDENVTYSLRTRTRGNDYVQGCYDTPSTIKLIYNPLDPLVLELNVRQF